MVDKRDDLVTWLQTGVDYGFITPTDAIRMAVDASLQTVAAQLPAVDGSVRVKKDGTPKKKPGRKPKQMTIPVNNGETDEDRDEPTA